MSKKVTVKQAELALAEVVRQLSEKLGYQVPSGEDAAMNGEGPVLVMDWDWPGEPTPSIICEGLYADGDGWTFALDLPKLWDVAGCFAEPYAGYALCLYPRS
jgi:hypothetical protein